MTTSRYDAWQEFDPAVAAAIKHGIKTGDWSDIAAYDPDAAAALEHALKYDDWGIFDPSAARAIRAAVGQESLSQQMAEDRQFAEQERLARAKFGDAYDEHRTEILEYAVRNGIPNVETAFKAFVGPEGARASAGAPARGQDGRHADKVEGKAHEVADWYGNRRAAEIDAAEAKAIKMLQAHNEATGNGYRDRQLTNINTAADTRNRQRTEQTVRGRIDESPHKFLDRDQLDLQAEDLVRAANATPEWEA
jgi:hypothetical protein